MQQNARPAGSKNNFHRACGSISGAKQLDGLPCRFTSDTLRIPVVSHESDLTPGLANRLIKFNKVRHDKVKLPKRQKPHGYREPKYPFKYVPERF